MKKKKEVYIDEQEEYNYIGHTDSIMLVFKTHFMYQLCGMYSHWHKHMYAFYMYLFF
jgi:hypothetical protein